jgi:phenylalanyl-tRNA synthetase beta chain
VVVDESVSAERIADLIRKIGGVTITKIKLFDVYRGGQAGPGKKSLAFNLTYQKPDRTLTDEEVARIRQKIVKQLDKELGARLRS